MLSLLLINSHVVFWTLIRHSLVTVRSRSKHLLSMTESQEIGADRWVTMPITRPHSLLPAAPPLPPFLGHHGADHISPSSVHASVGVLVIAGLLLLMLLCLPLLVSLSLHDRVSRNWHRQVGHHAHRQSAQPPSDSSSSASPSSIAMEHT
jgi:hypothetical protein